VGERIKGWGAGSARSRRDAAGSRGRVEMRRRVRPMRTDAREAALPINKSIYMVASKPSCWTFILAFGLAHIWAAVLQGFIWTYITRSGPFWIKIEAQLFKHSAN
jgi:hypothetical protein